MTLYDLLIANWMRQNREKVLQRFLEKERCKTEAMSELMFLEFVEYNGH